MDILNMGIVQSQSNCNLLTFPKDGNNGGIVATTFLVMVTFLFQEGALGCKYILEWE